MFSYAFDIVGLLVVCATAWIFTKLWRRPWVPDITKKAVFITGCDSGFGRATSLSLDALGVPVFAGCNTEDGAKSLKASGSSRLHTLPLDVTKEDSVKRAYTYVMDNLPKEGTVLWGIINNAGIADPPPPLEMTTTQDFRKVYDVNIFGLVSVTLAFLPALKKSRGRIVNTSSTAGILPSPFFHSYASSKFAVKGFSDCIRQELMIWGVKVCTMHPGGFNTGIQTNHPAHFERIWNAYPEINKDYGPEYLKAAKYQISYMQDDFATDISPVVNGYQHALFAQHPKTHYFMGPYSNFLKFLIFYTPTWFTDWLVPNIPVLKRPLPQVLRQ